MDMDLPLTSESPAFCVFMDYLNQNMVRPFGYQVFTAQFGSKYIRVVAHYHNPADGGSAYCFIERATGNVLKTATWKAPAKHVRGNILEGPEKFGLTQYGAVYLR
jgi:hypothetical protein